MRNFLSLVKNHRRKLITFLIVLVIACVFIGIYPLLKNAFMPKIPHEKGTFDFKTVLSNITITNRRISSESKFKDLGKKFTLGKCILDFSKEPKANRNTQVYMLIYEDEEVGNIELTPDNLIIGIYLDDNFPNEEIDICGVNFKTNFEELVEIFGKPTLGADEDFKINGSGSIYYGGVEEPNIHFYYRSFGMYKITISMLGDTSDADAMEDFGPGLLD
jgi:hypothetical protein